MHAEVVSNISWGRWNKGRGKGRWRALTPTAVFEYTEELVIVTVPTMMYSPPPCTHRSNGHSIGALKWGKDGKGHGNHSPTANRSVQSEKRTCETVSSAGRWMKSLGGFGRRAHILAVRRERGWSRLREASSSVSSIGALKRGKDIRGKHSRIPAMARVGA